MVSTGLAHPAFPFLANPLEYIPKASPQGLLPYLATDSCLTKKKKQRPVIKTHLIIWMVGAIRASNSF